jgi:hypothetical protein
MLPLIGARGTTASDDKPALAQPIRIRSVLVLPLDSLVAQNLFKLRGDRLSQGM